MGTTRRITKAFYPAIGAHRHDERDQRLKICYKAPIDCASDSTGEVTQVVAKDEMGGMTTLTFLEVQTPYFHSKRLAEGVTEKCYGVSLVDEFDPQAIGYLLLHTQWFDVNVDDIRHTDDSPSVKCAIDYAAKRARVANIGTGVFLGLGLLLVSALCYLYRRKCSSLSSRLFLPIDSGRGYGSINSSSHDSESQQQSVPDIEQEAQGDEDALSEEAQTDRQRRCCRVM